LADGQFRTTVIESSRNLFVIDQIITVTAVENVTANVTIARLLLALAAARASVWEDQSDLCLSERKVKNREDVWRRPSGDGFGYQKRVHSPAIRSGAAV
jgi:hypothetical protein